MDANGMDEPDGLAQPGTKQKGWPSAAVQEDKKTVFWMGGVMECFSTVFSLFSKAEENPVKDTEWEVPFSELSEFMYLGAGAQGTVSRSTLRGELVAVKKVRDRSEANIKHLRKLDHENIVRFRGVSLDGPMPCIIMEYCQYGPLFEFIHSKSYISAVQTFRWARDIALGMSYLHNNKIIHRDLKSPNILITDNLLVKVSDFGTSKEWDDVSAIMSFTGTVAWMAPEVIRHEPCSERVDVWSYGVVLWELLTHEIPYKNLETHAIIWGVGTDTISLPIPSSCPENIQHLLKSCWNRVPRNRPQFMVIAAYLELTDEELEMYPASFSYSPQGPQFKIIAEILEVTTDTFAKSHVGSFSATQTIWREEIREGLKFIARTKAPDLRELTRREEMKLAREFRFTYEEHVDKANQIFMEVCAVRLQLEQREKDVSEREKAAVTCRCGARKNLKLRRQSSSSSENHKPTHNERRRKKKDNTPAQVVVNFVSKTEKTVSVAVSPDKLSQVLEDVSACACDDTVANNNTAVEKAPIKKKETSVKLKDVYEQNGNIIKKSRKKSFNDNDVPDIAQV